MGLEKGEGGGGSTPGDLNLGINLATRLSFF